MVRYLFDTIGDLTYQSPLVVHQAVTAVNTSENVLHIFGCEPCSSYIGVADDSCHHRCDAVSLSE